MKNTFKKLLSVILCAVMLFTTASVALAAEKEPPFVEVDAKFADIRKDLEIGETTDVTIEWQAETGVPFEVKYYANGDCCEVDFIPDDRGGVSGATVKAVSAGSCFIGFQILDTDGNIQAIDYIEIRVLEPDTRPLGEKIEDFFKGIFEYFEMLAYMGNLLSVLFGMSIAGDLTMIYNWFNSLFKS